MTFGYRKEIDGLRAIAILPVIFFHAGFQLFSGGYIGVDVFFVISGFLITSILLDEYQQGTFSFSAFYERRARRILPALAFVLLCCLPFAYYLFSPLDFRAFAKSLLGANIFLANVVSYQQTDYFDAAAEIKPLLHLWSLSIEEQYYLFLPLLLAVFIKRGQVALFAVLIAIASLSLFYSEHVLYTNERASFFFISSRAWELLVGSLAAALVYYKLIPIHVSSNPRWFFIRQVLSIFGIFMVLIPIFLYSKDTPFPGLSAVIPVLGSAFVLLFAVENTWVQRLLSLKPLVGVGLISYSAYLWHQPVLAFVRYQSQNSLSISTLLGLLAVVMALAYLSWRYIERPFRDKQRITRKEIWVFSLVSIFFFSALSFYIYKSNGLPKRFDGKYAEAFYPHEFKVDNFCRFKPMFDATDIEGCEFGDPNGKRTVFLVGDSHADALFGGLHESFQTQGIKGVRIKVLKCPHYIPGMIAGSVNEERITLANQCSNNYQALFTMMSKHANSVVLAVRWTARTSPISGGTEQYFFDNQEGGVELKPNISNFAKDDAGQWTVGPDGKTKALHYMLKGFTSAVDKVIVVYPVPEVGWDIPRYNFAIYAKTREVQPIVSTSYEIFKRRNDFSSRALDSFSAPNLLRVKPENYFCNTFLINRCVAQNNFIPFYYDTNHLSSAGAKPLTDDVVKLLN